MKRLMSLLLGLALLSFTGCPQPQEPAAPPAPQPTPTNGAVAPGATGVQPKVNLSKEVGEAVKETKEAAVAVGTVAAEKTKEAAAAVKEGAEKAVEAVAEKAKDAVATPAEEKKAEEKPAEEKKE